MNRMFPTFLLLLFLHLNPTSQAADLLDYSVDAGELRIMLLKSFDAGGEQFLAHAENYKRAVIDLDKILKAPKWDYQGAADACERLAVVLEEGPGVFAKLNSQAFRDTHSTSTTKLRNFLNADTNTLRKFERVLQERKSSGVTNAIQKAEQTEAEIGASSAKKRLVKNESTLRTFDEVLGVVEQRNDLAKETVQVHLTLAKIYRDIKETILVTHRADALNEAVKSLSIGKQALEEKIHNTRKQMEAVLDRLQESSATNIIR